MKVILILLTLALATPAWGAGASRIQAGSPACLSKDMLNQLIKAVQVKDGNALLYLLENGCIFMKEAMPITILDSTWDGYVKLRAYKGGTALVVWTTREFVEQ